MLQNLPHFYGEKYLVFLKKGNCPFIIVFENDVDPLVVSFGKNPHSSWGSAMTFRSCCQSLFRKLVKMNQRSSDWLDGYAIIAAMVRHHRKQLQEASRERGEIFHPGRPTGQHNQVSRHDYIVSPNLFIIYR